MTPILTIVMPSYNEAITLPAVLADVIPCCEEHGWKLIVVNDGSTDTTRHVLDQFKDTQVLQVFHHKLNRGYGGALKTGISHANSQYVLTMDADGQHRLEDVAQLLDAAQQTDADLVIGSRVLQGKAGFSRRYRELGKSLIRFITSILMPLPIHDLNSGFKLYNTALVKQYLPLCPNSMAFSDIVTLAFINQRHLVIERPIEVRERSGGKSTISTRTAVETLLEIMNIVMLFNPMRIFIPASLLFILAGLAWGLPIVLAGRGFSAATVLSIMTGFIFLLLGLVAEQLAAIRKGSINLPSEGGNKDENE